MTLRFVKMNGAGNDFVMLDNRDGTISLAADQISRLCDRHRGVGADGVLLAEPAENGLRMRYYNADGGEASMCGNGARCFARFAAVLTGNPTDLRFLTGAGEIGARIDGSVVELDMGEPHSWGGPQDLDLLGTMRTVWSVNTGVPHAVAFLDTAQSLHDLDIGRQGAALRNHPAFAPHGTNANFAHAESPGRIALRTYERGVEAETLACGTGVCAAALLHARLADHPGPVSVRVRGGDTLSVSFRRVAGAFHDVVLRGPADFVFEGEISL